MLESTYHVYGDYEFSYDPIRKSVNLVSKRQGSTHVLLADLKDFIAKIDKKLIVDTEAFGQVIAYYRSNIRQGAKVTDKARTKVYTRLKSYPPEQLAIAIGVFATDEWNMKHNSHRGIAWFFRSDDAVDALLNKEEYQAPSYVDDSKCPHCKKMMSKKIFRQGATEVPKAMWDIALYFCDACHYHHRYNPATVPNNDLLLGNGRQQGAARGDGALPPQPFLITDS